MEFVIENHIRLRHDVAVRKSLLASILFSVIVLIIPAGNSATVKTGSRCAKLGANITSLGFQYECVKSGKKLIWKRLDPKRSTNPIPIPSSPSVQNKTMPPVVGPNPSSQIIAFYYGWYGNPE